MVTMQNFIPFFWTCWELKILVLMGLFQCVRIIKIYIAFNYFFIQIFFWGNAIPAGIALLLCVIQKGFSVQVTPKKPCLHLFRLGFNVKLQIPAIIWNIAAKGEGTKHGCKNRNRRKVAKYEPNVEMLCWKRGGGLS